MNESDLFKRTAVGLIAVWLVLFVLAPNAMILLASALTRHETEFVTLPFTWENYARLFDPLYFQVFAHSLAMALITTALCLLVAYPFAALLARARPRLRRVLLVLVVIPFWTNSLIRTYAIKVLLTAKGLLNQALMGLGLTDEPLRMMYTEGAVILGMVYVLLPFMILPLYANLEKLDPRHLEAARDLGAGRLQTFLRVLLPLTMPGIIAGCLLVFLPALGLFYIPDLLGGAKNLVIGNVIKNQFLDARDWPFGAAASVLLTLAMALLLAAYYWSAKRLDRKVVDTA